MVTKCSFRHNLNYSSDQKSFLAAQAAQDLRNSQTHSLTHKLTHKQTNKLTLSEILIFSATIGWILTQLWEIVHQHCSTMFNYDPLCSTLLKFVQFCLTLFIFVQLCSTLFNMFNFVQLCAAMHKFCACLITKWNSRIVSKLLTIWSLVPTVRLLIPKNTILNTLCQVS